MQHYQHARSDMQTKTFRIGTCKWQRRLVDLVERLDETGLAMEGSLLREKEENGMEACEVRFERQQSWMTHDALSCPALFVNFAV